MATGEIQKLRHEIRDLVGDAETYNGLAGRPGLSFDAQRAELNGIVPRVGEKAAAYRARADALEAKQGQIEELVAQAVAIVDSREANPNFAAAPAEEAEEDEDFDDEDFEEYEELDEEDEEEPASPLA
jgi:hypothetical protein